ncbi:MAG: hypothetical protein Q9160_004188 [Pyrenula sp. 1 TL-2023]
MDSIVFVHGLFGDRYKTWTKAGSDDTATPMPLSGVEQNAARPARSVFPAFRKTLSRHRLNSEEARRLGPPTNPAPMNAKASQGSAQVFWPRDLLPTELPNCRILTWGYDVDIDHALSSASTATVFNLLADLADVRLCKGERERPLIFFAHSLGGIVVKDAVTQSRMAQTHLKKIAPATCGICFMGTPHRGASLAAIGETVFRITKLYGKSPNLQVLQALKYDAETLDRIQPNFKQTLCDPRCSIQIRSFREAMQTHGITLGLQFLLRIPKIIDL